MSDRINVTRSSMPPIEEYVNEIKSLWETHWLTNMGEKHKLLENSLCEYLNVPNITLFTNGHLALENVIASMGLSGEIITTPFTFVSTTHSISRNGIKPIFCDINEEDYTIDTEKLEKLITPKTTAIVPVHVYGNICNYKEIDRIAKKHGLKVIYDAAHAFGAKIDGKNVAELGDSSMFSFHATKVFNTVEGGCVAYSDDSIKQMLDLTKNFGIPGNDRIVYAGGNAKMSEFHAAMGVCNLRHVDEYIAGRKIVAERYQKNLSGVKGLGVWNKQDNVESNYAYFPVVFDGSKYTCEQAANRLAEQNIFARRYFYPLTNDCECYGFNGDETPMAKYISQRVLTLPLYPDLSLDDVDRICEIISD